MRVESIGPEESRVLWGDLELHVMRTPTGRFRVYPNFHHPEFSRSFSDFTRALGEAVQHCIERARTDGSLSAGPPT